MSQEVQPASVGKCVPYARPRPEETTLYKVVQEQVETFFAQVEAETGAGLPDFVKDEFNAYLECGSLANGFLRLPCADCAHEKIQVTDAMTPRIVGNDGPGDALRILFSL